MKRLTMAILGLGLAATLPAVAQQQVQLPDARPPREEGRFGKTEPLTAAQQAQVMAILSKYDANTLTADKAKAIHEAFRQAGIHGGPAMNEAVKAAGFDPDRLRDLAPPPSRPGESGPRAAGAEGEQPPADGDQRPAPQVQEGHEHGKYSVAQAISDRAQLSTIAFSGLAFVTGEFGASTFMPPGKVCDFFGFQYMRDIDAAGKGHNPAFLTRIAADVLHTLNDAQRQRFADLAAEQAGQFDQLAVKRMPLIKAFHRELDGSIPKGTTGLSRDAVIRYVGDFFAVDAELSYRRAEVFGQIVASLTAEQKATFAKMKFGDFNTWPDMDEREALKRPNPGASQFFTVAYMTYASEFFSWYAGSVEADTYFCPERHGTYFGSFYMKDMPAMGKRNFDISTAVTGDSGEAFLQLLSAEQRNAITSIIERQRKLLTEVVEVRQAISVELRKLLAGNQTDKAKVMALGRRYGELDGEMSWMYATAFAKVGRTLTPAQRAVCVKLRNLNGYKSAPAYLYSQPLQKVPDLPDTDFLFGAGNAAREDTRPPEMQRDLPTTGGRASPRVAHQAATEKAANTSETEFILRSSEVADGGTLPRTYTGDGESATLPLEWSGAPAGTKSYAIIMHHIPGPGDVKWYWILYNIPADTQSLQKNVKNIGIQGNNSVNGRTEYAPPHSKGPGPKTYIYTVYALSAPVELTVKPSEVTRAVLLDAMKDRILASAELKVVYTRPAGATGEEARPAP